MPASPSMNVIAERQDAVFTKPTSNVTLPVSFISLEMSYALLPSVDLTRGSASSLSPARRTAPAVSLLMKFGALLLSRPRCRQTPSHHAHPSASCTASADHG